MIGAPGSSLLGFFMCLDILRLHGITSLLNLDAKFRQSFRFICNKLHRHLLFFYICLFNYKSVILVIREKKESMMIVKSCCVECH